MPRRPEPDTAREADASAERVAPPLSHILRRIAADESRQRISVGDLLESLHDRAIGALIFVFALPNIVPMPPGASSILGTPLLFLTAQLTLGLPPRLPRVIAVRSMDRAHFAAIVHRVAPWLARAERLLRPRLALLTRPPLEQVVGAICLLLSVILFLPIPMGNMLPAAAICMFSLAILERDGLWVLAGLCAAAGSVVLIWGVLFALFRTGLLIVARLFG